MVVFDKLALEFPQHGFTVAEKSQIITKVCHPKLMRQNMQDCVTGHLSWGIGIWVKTLEPICVSVAIPGYFFINKMLEAKIFKLLAVKAGILKSIVNYLSIGTTNSNRSSK